MSDKVESIWKWVERIMPVLGSLGAIVGAVGFLWLSSAFLPRQEYNNDRKEARVETESYRREFTDAQAKQSATLIEMQKTLAVMAEAGRWNDRQDALIQDHETRIRAVEKARH